MLEKLKTGSSRPLVIVARGDCTTRRSIALNSDFFELPPVLRQSQKSTFGQLLDAISGLELKEEFLYSISHVHEMPRTLASYYLGQANREVLDCNDADLAIFDSYADMNFSLWRSREGGPRFWIHPKYLVDRDAFLSKYEELGRASIEQSVKDATELIDQLRKVAPELPVVFLNQQVDYYPKLNDRVEEYYKLGDQLAQLRPSVFYGGVVAKEDLELADIGSCGPGNTLHFQGSTYARMLQNVWSSGLQAAVDVRQGFKDKENHDSLSSSNVTHQTSELKSAPCKFAELVITEILEPNLMIDESCGSQCAGFVSNIPKTFDSYFYMAHKKLQTEPPKYTPMMIDLEPVNDFENWFSSVTTLTRRQFRKAENAGLLFEPYNPRNHTPDIFEINNSKEIRSGGSIRGNLTKSIEEMGGIPTVLSPVNSPDCMKHWRQTFACFLPTEGYMQGELKTDKKLIAYISVVRFGEFALFAQIMGHGDYLHQGVVDFLTQNLVRSALFEEWGKASGLRFLMYGGAQNGGEGLFNFKRRSGFKPYIVSLPTQPGYPSES